MTDYELTAEEEVTPYIRRRMDKAEYAQLSLAALIKSAQAIVTGLNGDIQHWSAGIADMYKNDAAYLGLTLLTDEELIERDLTLRPDARPIAYRPYGNRKTAAIYIAECHTLLGDLRRNKNELPF